jgi:DnaK suppressor protein
MDRTVQSAARDLAVQTMDDEHRKLRETEAAIRRIERGKFGECLRCEEPIAERRLNAVPWAAFCIGCQEEADRLHRLVGQMPAAA